MTKEKHIEFYLSCGDNLQEEENYDRAIENYIKAIEACGVSERFEDHKVAALLELSHCYLNLEKYENVIINTRKAVELDPRDEWGWRMMGISLIKLSKFQEAIYPLTNAIEADPKGRFAAYSYYYRGEAYRLSNSIDKADKDFRRTLQFDPTNKAVLARRRACGIVVETDLPICVLWKPQEWESDWDIFHTNKNIIGLRNGDIFLPNEHINDCAILPGLGDVQIEIWGLGIDMSQGYSRDLSLDSLISPCISYGKNVIKEMELKPFFKAVSEAINERKNITLTGFEFSNCKIDATDIAFLHSVLPDIEYLGFIECSKLNGNTINEISRFDKLEKLRLENIDDVILEKIASFISLRQLFIDRSPNLTDEGISWIENNSSYKEVVIRACKKVSLRRKRNWTFV